MSKYFPRHPPTLQICRMAPIHPSVASVRANNPNHRSSTAPSSASVVSNNVSTHSLDDNGHGQDTLSEVPNPASPPPKPPVAAPSPPQPRSSREGRSHVVAGIARVPVRIDEAAAIKNIEKITTSAWGLLNKWPLDGLFGWLDGGKETKPAPGAVQEETFTDTPPPYSLK